MVIVTTDVVIVDYQKRTLWLATRKARPVSDPWWIGGRRRAGESLIDAARRNFHRETGLLIDPSRFAFVRQAEFICATRQQEPQNVGCHYLSDLFSVKITEKERAAMALDKAEYEVDFGLREFDRDALLDVQWSRREWGHAMMATYEHLFLPMLEPPAEERAESRPTLPFSLS